MTSEVFTRSAIDEVLPEQIPAGVSIVDGHPLASYKQLPDVGGVTMGIWEMTPGIALDVEQDEIFVVVSGAGHLTLGDGREVELAPGAVVHLSAGESTRWAVTETLRKVYLELPA